MGEASQTTTCFGGRKHAISLASYLTKPSRTMPVPSRTVSACQETCFTIYIRTRDIEIDDARRFFTYRCIQVPVHARMPGNGPRPRHASSWRKNPYSRACDGWYSGQPRQPKASGIAPIHFPPRLLCVAVMSRFALGHAHGTSFNSTNQLRIDQRSSYESICLLVANYPLPWARARTMLRPEPARENLKPCTSLDTAPWQGRSEYESRSHALRHGRGRCRGSSGCVEKDKADLSNQRPGCPPTGT